MTVRDAIVGIFADIKVSSGATICVDGVTAFQALVDDTTFMHQGLSLEVARIKNIFKKNCCRESSPGTGSRNKKGLPRRRSHFSSSSFTYSSHLKFKNQKLGTFN